MMSLEAIKAESLEASARAARYHLKPYVVYDTVELGNMPPFPFPAFGDEYEPKGWEFVEELFCDSSGMGADDEPALTARGLLDYIEQHLYEDDTYGYAIGRVGQFQVYVKVFKKLPNGEV